MIVNVGPGQMVCASQWETAHAGIPTALLHWAQSQRFAETAKQRSASLESGVNLPLSFPRLPSCKRGKAGIHGAPPRKRAYLSNRVPGPPDASHYGSAEYI